ncbi:MAG: hypothetical protein PVJ07_00745, partial [Anaerolineales bacterium]
IHVLFQLVSLSSFFVPWSTSFEVVLGWLMEKHDGKPTSPPNLYWIPHGGECVRQLYDHHLS